MGKIFTNGEILTAADVNNELNPYTNAAIPYRVATGAGSITGNGGAWAETTVTFPTGRFTVKPNVIASVRDGSFVCNIDMDRTTASQTVLQIHRNDGANFTSTSQVAYVAIQMTSTVAEG